MLKDKYAAVLELGEKLKVENGYVNEEAGKLKVGGAVHYQYDSDRIWDKIKEHAGWQSEIECSMDVKNKDIYGVYTVQSGDTLSKISKQLLGNPNLYMQIFKLNTDILDNPNMIKVGQKLKLPNKETQGGQIA